MTILFPGLTRCLNAWRSWMCIRMPHRPIVFMKIRQRTAQEEQIDYDYDLG